MSIRVISNRAYFGHFNPTNDINPLKGKSGVYVYKDCFLLFFAKIFGLVVKYEEEGKVYYLNKNSFKDWLDHHGGMSNPYSGIKTKIMEILVREAKWDPKKDAASISDLSRIRFLQSAQNIQKLNAEQLYVWLDYFNDLQLQQLTLRQLRSLDLKRLSNKQFHNFFEDADYEDKALLCIKILNHLTIPQINGSIDRFGAFSFKYFNAGIISELDPDRISEEQFGWMPIKFLTINQLKVFAEKNYFTEGYLYDLSDEQLQNLKDDPTFDFGNSVFAREVKRREAIKEAQRKVEENIRANQAPPKAKKPNVPPNNARPHVRPEPRYENYDNFEYKNFKKQKAQADGLFERLMNMFDGSFDFFSHLKNQKYYFNNPFGTDIPFFDGTEQTRYEEVQQPEERPIFTIKDLTITGNDPLNKLYKKVKENIKSVENYHKIFDLEDNYTDSDLNKRYRKMMLHAHPDKNPQHAKEAEEIFKVVTEIKDYLLKESEKLAKRNR